MINIWCQRNIRTLIPVNLMAVMEKSVYIYANDIKIDISDLEACVSMTTDHPANGKPQDLCPITFVWNILGKHYCTFHG